ncbi:hypothetical protein GIB67_029953 [Kingdonia uniflora]|uniref:Protein kinase domain-containing protein n=1 Tax=Kingdonia uniflora TaxID=39325 RepID=A0A7J7MXQ1_9MAGN|nr:hypothetical protein GIB67_029953 [Kingdonia uniflora]
MVGTCSISSSQEWVKGNTVGSGSFGVVNLAMNKITGELFVVKSSQSGVGFESLSVEADILESLDSPYVVKCLGKDLLEEGNGEKKFNLFMEFMAGGSLSDVASKFGGSLDESVIRLYVREILKGLEYIHGNGIVHCDLKCKNVLLGSNGNIKLADFGCAKRLNDGTSSFSSHTIFGTPLWMAPEVLREEKLDIALDIWSLGCTIIEMATGRPPWGDEVTNPMAAVFKIACGDDTPQFPTHFSADGFDFLSKCLQRDPNMRWSSGELLEHPFVSTSSLKKSSSCNATSPASVLEVESEDDSDVAEPQMKKKHPRSIPFATRRCYSQRERARRRQKERDLVSLGNWITVRSG